MLYTRSFTAPALMRRISTNLLYEYFTSRKVLQDFNWNSFQRSPDQLMDELTAEFQKIPIAKQDEIEEELRDVHNLSGFAAQETLQSVAKQFKILWDDEMPPEDRAIRVLMENPEAFRTACNWAELESYESFQDYVGPKAKDASDWSDIKANFTEAWKLLLHNQAKGYGRVYIEHYQSDDRQAYLVYYEAPKKFVTRFDDKTDKPAEKPEKPVLESLMIYYPKLGKLKIKARHEDIAEQARDAYSRLALGQEDFLNAGKERVYDLNQFKKKLEPQDFPTDPKDEIVSVQVVSLRFRLDGLTNDTIEVNSVKSIKARLKTHNLNLTDALIKKVRLQVKMASTGAGSTKTFSLTMPNKNTLGDSLKDRLLEKYLVKWGIANR
ncbi:MAG: hypothetical protein WC980_04940 [Candidatus Brocadiia bacterium]